MTSESRVNTPYQQKTDTLLTRPMTPSEQDAILDQCLALFDFSVPLPEKQADTIRIFYNNCNGLEINSLINDVLKRQREKKRYQYLRDIENPTKLDKLLKKMKLWDVDLANLSETCVAWENIAARRVVQQITNGYDQTGCWVGASSNIHGTNCYKPGGTATLAMGRCNGRIIDKGTDPWGMGRWSYIVLSGTGPITKLLVITGYRTGYRSGNAGYQTAWTQQTAILFKENRVENPSEAFFTDLESWICKYRTTDMEVILCLDANEQWSPQSSIQEFADTLNLVNLTQEFCLADTHPNVANLDKSTTIDYCFSSEKVSEHVRYAASVPYELDTLGDHRGFILDVQMINRHQETHRVRDHRTRKLQMNNPIAVEKYLTEVHKKFGEQNIFQRSKKLLSRVRQGQTDMAGIMNAYETLDREVYGICMKAEKKSRAEWAGQFDWSPALVQAIKTLTYWRYRLRNSNRTALTRNLETELGIPYVPVSKCTIHQFINDSKLKLKEIQTNSRKYRQDHLVACAQQYANQHSLSVQQAVNELIAHEEARGTFKLLSSSLKRVGRTQLTTLWEAIDDNGDYTKDVIRKQVHVEAKNIHKALLRRNAKHLQQAAHTPFAKGWLKHNLNSIVPGVVKIAVLGLFTTVNSDKMS